MSIKGVDVFDSAKGEGRSAEPNKIVCWFIDTDYNKVINRRIYTSEPSHEI